MGDWEHNKLKWYADGNLYNTFEPHNALDSREWPFEKSFYMILNLAIGGNLGGSVHFDDDRIMEIDYVRVYCLDGTTTCPQLPEKILLRVLFGSFILLSKKWHLL